MKTIYLVPHTHYDVAWAFTKEDYLEIMRTILRGVANLIQKEHYKFIIEQIYLLKEIEDKDPELWAALKQAIQKGRIEIVDGQYLMADAMLPHGEVLIRNIYHGKMYCKEKFGVDVPVAWYADGFGLNAQMPQIYKKSGYKWLAFRRGAPKRISEFSWRGLDDTTILTHWMPLGYRAALLLEEIEKNFSKLEGLATTSNVLMPSGSGSTPPSEDIPEFVENWNKTHKDVKIKISTPSEFFNAVEKEKSTLRSIQGEIHSRKYSEVFPDVGSGRIWIINEAKKYETLLLNAEKLSSIAWLLRAEYPQKELNQAWEKMFYIAFHDVINGVGIDAIYNDVREIFRYLDESLNKILADSLDYISKQINTDGPSLIVFNLLSWQVTNWVEIGISFNEGEFKNPALLENENEILIELSEIVRYENGSIKKAKFGFIATVPPVGFRVYKIVERTKAFESKTSFTGTEISNEFYNIKINPENGIIEVKDKEENLILEGNEIVIEDEVGDLYFHNSRQDEPIATERGEGNFFATFKPKSLKVEGDSLKAKIIYETEYYGITWPYRLREKFKPTLYRQKLLEIKKEITIYHSIPRIEFATKIKNSFPNVRIRVRFNTPIESSKYSRETQFGIIKEPIEKIIPIKYYKVRAPAQASCIHWIDYSDEEKGIMLINKGNPDNDIYKKAIYLTLIRSVNFLSTDGTSGPWIPTPDALELKDYTFHYALYPYKKELKNAKNYKQAHQYTNPLIPIYANSKGKIPKEFSFIKMNPDSLILSTVKKAENDDALILRFYETNGKSVKGEIELFRDFDKPVHVNLLEQEGNIIKCEGRKIKLPVKAYEIVSLKFPIRQDVKSLTEEQPVTHPQESPN